MAAIFGLILSGTMMLPALVDLSDGNRDWIVFVGTGGVVAAVCTLVAVATRGASVRPTPRFGFLLVTTIWLVSTFVATLPLYFAETELTFAAAVFEAMSGLTTTGATAISGLDALPRGLLLWRSLLNFLGGIGIVGMALLILPSLRVGGMALFHLESSDRSGKLLPRVSQLASGIVAVYGVMTLICALLLRARHEPVRRLQPCHVDARHRRLLDPRRKPRLLPQRRDPDGGHRLHDRGLAALRPLHPHLPAATLQRWRDPQVVLFWSSAWCFRWP